MADFEDYAAKGIGQVPQSDLTGSLKSGIELAQAHEAHMQRAEQVKQAREELEMKKAHWLQSQVSSGAAIVDDSARSIYFKRLETQANRIGVVWDPATTPIIASREGALNIQKGQAALMKLPYDAQTRAYLDFKNAVGDPSAAEGFLFHAAEIHGQQLGLQASAAYKSREMGMEQSKMFESAKTAAHSQNKENVETIRYANRIQDMVMDPEARKDPYESATALAALAKNLFPGGVIRESEMAFLDHINPGMGQKVQSFIQGKLGQGQLTDDMWLAIGKLSQHMGVAAQSEVDTQKVASQKNLPPGMSAEDIYSTIPKFEPKDIRAAFPKTYPEVAKRPNAQPTPLDAYREKHGLSVEQIAAGVRPQAQPNPQPQNTGGE